MKFVISKLKETAMYRLPALKKSDDLTVYSDTFNGSYIVKENNREVCSIKIDIDGSELIIKDISLASSKQRELVLTLLRYAIEDLNNEYAHRFSLLDYQGDDKKEEALSKALKEACLTLDNEGPRPDYYLCSIRLGALYAECTNGGLLDEFPFVKGSPEFYDDIYGYPILLCDTSDEKLKLWFRYIFDEDEEHIYTLQTAILDTNENVYIDIIELEEDDTITDGHNDTFTEWIENVRSLFE